MTGQSDRDHSRHAHLALVGQGDPKRLPEKASQRIRDADVAAVCSLSCLEVAWLAKKQRIVLPVDIDTFFELALDKASIGLLPLTPQIAVKTAALPDIHKDPIDRVIIATSIEHGAELITKDEIVRRYPDVVTRWED